MKKIIFVLVTLGIGLPIQLFFSHYITFFGVEPRVLLLTVVAIGFLRGPMLGEVMGFSWGLMMDSIGINLFGINSLLLALAGYISGKLRRRVASERLSAQIVIGLVSTLLYGLLAMFIHFLLEQGGERVIFKNAFIGMILSVLVVTAIFWLIERWLAIWNLGEERL